MRFNLEKQERVVEILWKFGENIKKGKRPRGCMIKSLTHGVSLGTNHIELALREIMNEFGYSITEVQ